MPSEHNPGVMPPKAQSVFFAVFAILFLAALIVMPIIEIPLGWQVTTAMIVGLFACLDVLSGRGFTSQILSFFKSRNEPPSSTQG